jgi:HPt (histidine-containing phosphotransfer) domain-containing protein
MDGDAVTKPDHLRVRAEKVRKELGSCLAEQRHHNSQYVRSSNDQKAGTMYKIRLRLLHGCKRIRRNTGQRLCKLLQWLGADNDLTGAHSNPDPTESDQRLQQLLHDLQIEPFAEDLEGRSGVSIQAFTNPTDFNLLHKKPTIAEYAARFEYTAMARCPPMDNLDDDDDYSEGSELEPNVWPNPASEVQRLREQLDQLERLINDMQQAHQERVIREDILTCRQNERRQQLKAQANATLDEMNEKQNRVQSELDQCQELLRRLKEETRLVTQRRKLLAKSSKGLRHKYEQAANLLHSSLRQKQAEMMDTQRRLQLRRQQDVALIRAYRLQRKQLKRKLNQPESSAAIKKDPEDFSVDSESGENTQIEVEPIDASKFESDLQTLRTMEEDLPTRKMPQTALPQSDPSTCSSQLASESTIGSGSPQNDLKLRCLQQLHQDNRLCIRDQILKIRSNQGAKPLSGLVLLPSIEGVQPLTDEEEPVPDDQLKVLQDELLDKSLSADQIGAYPTQPLFSDRSGNNESYQVELPAEGTLVHNSQFPMHVRLIRFAPKCPLAKRFERETMHIIRQLMLRSHSSLAQQVELFRIGDLETSPVHLYAHIEERFAYTLNEFIAIDPLSPEDLTTIGESMASALMHLHDMGVAHTTLSADSVFVTSKSIVKIGRLDRSRTFFCHRSRRARLQPPPQLKVNTVEWSYAAPEIRESLACGKMIKPEVDLAKADVYSYGLLLWFCVVRQAPSNDYDDQCQQLDTCQPTPSGDFRDLVKECLLPRSPRRCTIFTALCHRFFTGN